MKKLISFAALAVTTAISVSTATAAQAAPDCAAANFSYTECSGSYTLGGGQNDVTDGGEDNIATQMLNGDDLFGTEDWNFGAKYDGSTSGANNEGLSVDGLGSTSGTFSFSDIDLATTDLAISLKSAKGFSLYYIEAGTLSDSSEIAWDTFGTSTNRKGKAQALSHLSYFTRVADIPELQAVKKVPEPAALSGLIAVGAAAALRRKKK